MTKSDHMKAIMDLLEIKWLQATAIGDPQLSTVVDTTKSIVGLMQQNQNYMTQVFDVLSLEDLRRIVRIAPTTHNDKKYEEIYATVFAQMETAADARQKSAELIREICLACCKLMVVKNFMETSTVKWNSAAEDDQSSMTSVINKVIERKILEIGRHGGGAAA
jgi:hypothetical protein